ncbi:acyltransferase [Spirosoma sp. KUDC1026]|uniref:acyltransferase n=1 Tax=Spirosoma sp. KUDC1026 TaxID=2745947 RepID=UPI00159BE081|nr:acyltransferase [Spirosoma sp. KUDC1026]QKZ13397.1 acyltransferase [Spirosoma sp. KUDC1026]
MSVTAYLNTYPALKRLVHYLLIPRNQARPRRWVNWVINPFVHKRHQSAAISATARLDVLPFNKFSIGARSTVEDFCVINNGVGDVLIGSNSLVGIGSVVIGPVSIGSDVIIAQHVVISGLNHGYQDPNVPIRKQAVSRKQIVIEDDCWIGANVTITAGVRIGRHSVVAGGSVVTRDVLPYSVVGGNPARVLKYYDEKMEQWITAEPASATVVSPLIGQPE